MTFLSGYVIIIVIKIYASYWQGAGFMAKKIITFFKNKINKIILIVLVIVAFLLFFSRTEKIDEIIPVIAETATVDVKIIEENLRSIAELVTLTYTYSDVGTFSEQKTFSLFGKEFEIWGTKKSFIITYDGEMKFGIDLSQVSIDESDNILTVTLPPPQMFSHEIKEDSISLLDEKTGLFSSFSMTDYSDFMTEQKDKMERRAAERELLSQAQSNAEEQIKLFVSAILGDVSEEYEIQFAIVKQFEDKPVL